MGEDGTTGLTDGSRVSKDSLRTMVIGDIDELSSVIGMVLVHALRRNNMHLSHGYSARLV